MPHKELITGRNLIRDIDDFDKAPWLHGNVDTISEYRLVDGNEKIL